MQLTAYIEGIGLLGPGLTDWPTSRPILCAQQFYQPSKTVVPSPALLPAAERRRSSTIVKLTLATGLEAIAAAGLNPAELPIVYSSSGGDGDNCHAICEMLASDDRLISPTRFHSSVHNAAAGYWSIATGAMTTASVLCAHDASFGAGLLEALAQVVADDTRTVLLACDTAYPEPLFSARPIPDAFGVALVLAPRRGERALAQIIVDLTHASADRLEDPALERMRTAIPAARGLPMLRSIALAQNDLAQVEHRAQDDPAQDDHGAQHRHVVLDYLDDTRLSVSVAPC